MLTESHLNFKPMKKQTAFILILFVSLIAQTAGNAQNVDTVIDRKHYNTVIKYHHFDYKSEQETAFITAYGTLKDSVKTGRWMYVLPDGRVLAIGKFRNGYKTGNWKYLDHDGRYSTVTWKASEKISDYVYFENNTNPELVDYDNADYTQMRVSGERILNPFMCWR